MPLMSSLLGINPKPTHPPTLVFLGPDTYGNITARNPQTNQEVAFFQIANKTLYRMRPTNQQICSFKRSSMSGSTTLQFPTTNTTIKMKLSGEGLGSLYQTIELPHIGKAKWAPSNSGSKSELRDKGKNLLASGKGGPESMSSKNPILEMYVPGNDMFLVDVILSAWVSMVESDKKDAEQLGAVAEVIGAVAGC